MHILPAIVYLAILVIALLAPYAAARSAPHPERWMLAISALAAAHLLLNSARGVVFPILSLVLLFPLLGLGVRALAGGVAAVLLFATVTWWTPSVHMGPVASGLFVLLGLGAAYLPRAGVSAAARNQSLRILPVMALAASVGLGVGLLTAPFGSLQPIDFAWHHWGAYVSPVEAWLAGGTPYRDFPIQYGLGPTAIVAAACGADCWRGIYAATIVANALYFAALAGCSVILTANNSRGMRWLALAALFCASFIWTAFPGGVGATAMTPSVAGLRFLPIALLLLHILGAERSGKPRDRLGHAIWLFDFFWSPEAAFFATLIWWPYLAFRGAGDARSSREMWLALLRGTLHGVLAIAGASAALALTLWILSAGAARPDDFLAYVLHPPGPLPINPLGTVWLAVAAIVLGLHGLAVNGASRQGRALYASLLGFLAALTYYLSRSHDNNILNLFPLMVILLVASLGAREAADSAPAFDQGFVRTVLAAMIAFVATANWTPWAEGATLDGPFNLGPSRLIGRFSPEPGTRPQVLFTDALNGLAYLRGRNAGAVVLLDDRKLIPWHPAGKAWTGVNNVANFESLPRSWVIRYVCRGALTYKRPGWILVDQRGYAAWAGVFEQGYEVREQVPFGAYRAYHLFPRRGPLACADS